MFSLQRGCIFEGSHDLQLSYENDPNTGCKINPKSTQIDVGGLQKAMPKMTTKKNITKTHREPTLEQKLLKMTLQMRGKGEVTF